MRRAIVIIAIASGCTRLPKPLCILKGEDCHGDGHPGDEAALPPWAQTFGEEPSSSGMPTLRRKTPEQVSGALELVFKGDCGYEERVKRITCDIGEYKAVSLGGLDFQATRKRDEGTKINTLIVARREMGKRAGWFSVRDPTAEEGSNTFDATQFWSELDPNSLYAPADPAATTAPTSANKKWRDQLDKIYWALLSRPPSEKEVAIHASAFLESRQDSVTRSAAWMELLYVLLMSAEYWHI